MAAGVIVSSTYVLFHLESVTNVAAVFNSVIDCISVRTHWKMSHRVKIGPSQKWTSGTILAAKSGPEV